MVVLATRGFIGEVTPLPQLVRGALNRPSVGSFRALPQVRLWSWGKRDLLSQSHNIGHCGPWGDVGQRLGVYRHPTRWLLTDSVGGRPPQLRRRINRNGHHFFPSASTPNPCDRVNSARFPCCVLVCERSPPWTPFIPVIPVTTGPRTSLDSTRTRTLRFTSAPGSTHRGCATRPIARHRARDYRPKGPSPGRTWVSRTDTCSPLGGVATPLLWSA